VIRLPVASEAEERLAELRPLLAELPGIEIAAEGIDGAEAVALAKALSPDVVLLDDSLALLSTVEVVGRLRGLQPATRVVAWCTQEGTASAQELLLSGAHDLYQHGAPRRALERALVGVSHRHDHRPGRRRSTRKRRVLLVDDDPALRTLLRLAFESADLEVYDAASAEQAREILAERRPAVIRRSSTATYSTTSARSASPTPCCASPDDSLSRSGA
jgi:DNA-binding NarL/FixJ family response regulator